MAAMPAPAPSAPPPDHPAAEPGARRDLEDAADAAAGCRACDLWERATQTVFGEGRASAPIVLVGEQPGDREDLEGHPFIGPAGRLLDEALREAGVDREQTFVTNVVKHFKWRPSGKRRLHERPNREEVRACRPWLDLELELVRPSVVVLLGATAAQSVLGPSFRITAERGRVVPPAAEGGPAWIATWHPSAILRARTPEDRATSRQALVEDLRTAASLAGRAMPSDRAGSAGGADAGHDPGAPGGREAALRGQ